MRAFKKKTTDTKVLQELVPLNALSEERFGELVNKIVVEEIRAKGYLFRMGDRDNQSIYLLDGKINLIDGHRKVASELEAGTDASRYPIASQQPRSLSARAVTRVVIARIDSDMLDAYLNWDHSPGAEVTEIASDNNQDWMTRMLQSEAFEKIPPAGIQRLLMKMMSLPVQAGEVIVREGDEGEYFYTIHSGRCIVTREISPGGESEILAELSSGDCFGEEALVSDSRRNATITMLSDGMLMRLAKKDFIELLQKPLVRYVSYEVATAMVDDGAVWVDVRSEGEYEEGAIEDSVNIPLSILRNEIPELVFNAQYIICCDTGSRSVSAAFILSHKGFEVYVLESGLNGMSADEFAHAGLPANAAGLMPATTASEPQQEEMISPDQDWSLADDGQSSGIEALRRENEALRQQVRSQRQDDESSFRRQLQLQSAEEEKQLLQEQNAVLKKDYQVQLKRLQLELEESKELIQVLQDEVGKTVNEEQQLQVRTRSEQRSLELQVKHLESESIQYAQHAEALQVELKAANDQLSQLSEESTAQLQEQGKLVERLRTELAQSRRDSAELQALQEQSAAGARQMEALQAELQDAQERISQFQAESETRLRDQQLVETLRTELEQSEQLSQGLQQEIEELQREKQTADERSAELEQFRHQLEKVQEENGELGGRLADELLRADELQQQLKQLHSQNDAGLKELQERNRQLTEEVDRNNAGRQELEERVEALQHERQETQQQLEASRSESDATQARVQQLHEHNQQLTEELDRSNAGRQELEDRVEALQHEHQETQQQLEASRSESDATQARVQQLQQENESLEGENQHLREQHQGLAEHAQGLDAEKQAMHDRLQTLQQELESQDIAFEDQGAAYEQQLAELGNQLEQAREVADRERQVLETALQEYKDETGARLEQQQHQHAELQQEHQRLASEGEAVLAERDDLERRLSTAEQDLSGRQQEIDRLNETVTSLRNTADEEVQSLIDRLAEEQSRVDQAAQRVEEQQALAQALQEELGHKETEVQSLNERLADEQTRAAQAAQSAEEQQARAEALQAELAHKEQTVNEYLEQLQAAQQQAEESRQTLLQHEAQVQATEQEHQAEFQAVRAELDGRNDLEREMQGQIERLGKQLEQSAEALQLAHDEAQENDQRLRNELVEERRARSEERAEMAARQKELKQQLTEVAGKHEGVLSSQTDIVEQAREEARREERERLRQELEQQGQSGEQVAAVQAELDRLREEAAATLAQVQKRSDSELAVAREQRAQAKAEIVGLKTQLKQLEQERDKAVSGREALERQVGALHNNASERPKEAHGDPDAAKLREELEDARMNIEIAIRLRTEAEAELERVSEHRDLLVRKLDEAGLGDEKRPAQVPDKSGKLIAASKQAPAESTGKAGFKYVVDDDGGGKRRWLGAVVGLGSVGITGLVIWLMLSVENPMAKFLDLVNMDSARSAWEEIRLPQWLDFVAKPGDDMARQEIQADLSAPVEAGPAASSPVVETPSQTPPAPDLPGARRSFRDALNGEGRGPLMLELAAGSYMMGSEGNSLNFEERPQHPVNLAPFSISKYEVSFAEYDRFARATGRRLPHDEKWGRNDRPVINVTWKDARAYARWLSKQTGHQYRLPTEAEWEFAARAGTTADYWWDAEAGKTPANCFNCGSEWDGNSSAPVGSFAANSLGLHDTAGNVQEWTEDCYHPSYQGAAADGSARQRAGCTQRVVRGGSYSSPIESLRSNKRSHYDQDTRIDNLGFRVVRLK